MSFFASDRERWLWLWAGTLLVTIYATLGPAQQLAAHLRERNLLGVAATLVLLLAAGAVLAHWSRRPPGRREAGVAVAIAIAYLMVAARMVTPEARTHLIEYGVVALLIHQALRERVRHGRHVPAPAAVAIGAGAALGLLDETIQSLLPNRRYDIVDVGFNALAAVMAVTASALLSYARKRDRG